MDASVSAAYKNLEAETLILKLLSVSLLMKTCHLHKYLKLQKHD